MEASNNAYISKALMEKINKILNGRVLAESYKDPDIYELLPIGARAHLKYKPISGVPRYQLADIVRRIERAGGIVAGSWRRGKEICNDLDILISKNNLGETMKRLNKSVKMIEPFINGDEIIRTFILIRPRVYINVDIFIYDDLAPYLLYATGSKWFNKYMRGIAKSSGYLLNQHGLYVYNNNELKKIKCLSEEDIFKELKISYREPYCR